MTRHMGPAKSCVASVLLITSLAYPGRSANFAGGTGSANDPYQIATADQLVSIGADPNLLNRCFVLLNDINLDPNAPGGSLFTRAIIAPDVNDSSELFEGVPFTGCFDGQGCTIENLTIQVDVGQSVGLFGAVGKGARVYNLRIEDAFIGGRRACRRLGIMAGYVEQATIMNCSVSGRIAVGSSASSIGGLVGFVWFNGRIVQSCASTDISGGDAGESFGGIAGDNGGDIRNCYATGSISGGQGCKNFGGLVGRNSPPSFDSNYGAFSLGYVSHCYSVVRVLSGPMSNSVGGLVGSGDHLRTARSFWNVETSHMSLSAGGIGLTTTVMQDPNTYLAAGWDLFGECANGVSDVWYIPEEKGYPVLTILTESFSPPALTGKGTADDPFIVRTVEDLGAISHHSVSASCRLLADMDLSGIVWSVAPISPFDGRFDGSGFAISNLSVAGHSYLGLFDSLGPHACVTNLVVKDVNIVGDKDSECVGALTGSNSGQILGCDGDGSTTAEDCVGGLVGLSTAGGSISSSHFTGPVSGLGGTFDRAGGLVGLNAGTIANSSANVVLAGRLHTLGGLVAANGGNINGCRAHGSIVGEETIGGLVGSNRGTLSDSYSDTDIHSRKLSIQLGGLVGVNGGRVVNCYSIGTVFNAYPEDSIEGGLIGRNSMSSLEGIVVNSFWDINAAGIPASAAGIGLTTAQMQTSATFAAVGWDIENTWMICDGKDYPRLRWENTECDD